MKGLSVYNTDMVNSPAREAEAHPAILVPSTNGLLVQRLARQAGAEVR